MAPERPPAPPAADHAAPAGDGHAAPPAPPAPARRRNWRRIGLIAGGVVLALTAVAVLLRQDIALALNTVSTDDAYVNSYVTSVAPRVAGQVVEVLVND